MIDLMAQRRAELIQASSEATETFNENVARNIVAQFPGLADGLVYNTDTMQPAITKDVPLMDGVTLKAGAVDDNTVSGLLMFIQANGYEKAKEPALRSALNFVASTHPVAPFRLFLERAKKNGKVRPGIFHELMVDKLAAKDEPYSVFWLLSLMSAIYRHQTFNDEGTEQFSRVPYRYFMFGAQGIGKSFLLTRLSNGLEFNFTGDLTNKDTQVKLSGNVIANADDTASQLTKVVDEIKSAITTPYYNVRLPYAKSSIRVRSRAVFVGSTNRLQAYTDTTGVRREMPINLNYGMDEHTAEYHGKAWVSDLLKNEPNYFLDLWASYLDKYTAFDPSPYSHEGIDQRRHEIIDEHRRESDLTYILSTILSLKVPADYATLDNEGQTAALQSDLAAETDPFTGEASGAVELGELEAIPATPFIKRVKFEYGAKIARSTIVEGMSDFGYREARHEGRQFVKRVRG